MKIQTTVLFCWLFFLFFWSCPTAQAEVPKRWTKQVDSLIANPPAAFQNFPKDLQEMIRQLPKLTDGMEHLGMLDAIITRLIFSDAESALYYAKVMKEQALYFDIAETSSIAHSHLSIVYTQSGEYNRAKENGLRAIQIADSVGFLMGVTEGYSRLTSLCNISGDFQEGCEYARRAIKVAKQYGDAEFLANAYLNMGNNFLVMAQYDSATYYLIESKKLFDDERYLLNQLQIDQSLAHCYLEMTDTTAALLTSHQVLKDADPSIHLYPIATVQNIIGAIKTGRKRYAEAIHHLRKANDLFGTIDMIPQQTVAKANISFNYILEGKLDSAAQWIEEALEMAAALQAPTVSIPVLSTASRLEQRYQNWDKAHDYLERCLAMAKEIEGQNDVANVLQELAAFYERKGDIENALAFQKQFRKQEKKVFNLKKEQQISLIRTQYQTDRKEAELRQERSKSQRNQSMLIASLLILSLLGILSINIYKKNNIIQKTNHQLSEAKKKSDVLLKEVQHRVKNNLQFVASLLDLHSSRLNNEEASKAVEAGRDRIETMGLLHQKLLYKEDQPTSIDMKEYLGELTSTIVDSSSMDKELELSAQIAPVNLDIDKALPMGLIVNELVSNSIKHTTALEQTTQISVSLREEADKQLVLVVADNGPGLPDVEKWNQKQTSFGLDLVSMLCKQLGAVIQIKNAPGAHFKITFAS
ncbi:MAG: sensor histidine kinase [Bacteroidota bacterium]